MLNPATPFARTAPKSRCSAPGALRIALALSVLGVAILPAQIYVAPDGSDADPGTREKPFATIARAVSVMAPGDTVFIGGGVHAMNASLKLGASTGGTVDRRSCLFAAQGQRPVLDFSPVADGTKGIRLEAGYWHLRGIEVKGAGDNGLHIDGGSNNLVEACVFCGNRDSGVQLDGGASGNRFVDCDSHHNADPPDFADADGFAAKLDVGTGNSFHGCRSWANCDDGWDGYLRGADGVTTTYEDCWTWGNGYLPDGTDPGPQANGNGFKLGGGDGGNGANLRHHAVLVRCLAFDNKGKGFDQNNNAGSAALIHCTGARNAEADFRFPRPPAEGCTLRVVNSVSYGGAVDLGAFVVQQANSWMPPLSARASDFLSLDTAGAAAARPPQGGLPGITFLHPAPGSGLADAGVNLGFPYQGAAPDLGAFESPPADAAEGPPPAPKGFSLGPNYPNPFNPETRIPFTLRTPGPVSLAVYDLSGRRVAVLVEGVLAAGPHMAVWRPDRAASGVYWIRLEAGNGIVWRRMTVQK